MENSVPEKQEEQFDPQQAIEKLTGSGYVVRKKDEEDGFLQSQRQRWENETAEKYGKTWREKMTAIEEPLYQLGYKKVTNEDGKPETADQFAVRVAKELHQRTKELAEAKSTDPTLKTQLEALQQQLQSKEQHWQEQATQREQKSMKHLKSFMVDSALNGLRFDESLNEAARQAVRLAAKQTAISKIAGIQETDEGQFVLLDSEGQVMTSKQDGKALSIEDVITGLDFVKGTLFSEKKPAGTGAKAGKASTAGKTDLPLEEKMTAFELNKTLKQKGMNWQDIDKTVAEYRQQYKERFGKDLPIR